MVAEFAIGQARGQGQGVNMRSSVGQRLDSIFKWSNRVPEAFCPAEMKGVAY